MSASKPYKANKGFGQHFLTNEAVVHKMISLSDLGPNTQVLEVGPGPGILTRALLTTSLERLTCIEIDKQFISGLNELEKNHPQLCVLMRDALKVSLKDIGSSTIIANLPYNVGSQLIVNWLHEINYVVRMVVMLQKEVVDRMTAIPGTKSYGRLSVLCQALCHVKKEFIIKPGNFSPPPKVDSAIVHLIPKPDCKLNCIQSLGYLTGKLFQNRRKMVQKALRAIAPDFMDECQSMGVLPTMRAENITVDQYVDMANVIKSRYELPL